jgi:acetoin utilization protein AcuC
MRDNADTAGETPPSTTVLWAPELLRYDFGDHPLNPVRVELTMALAREFGVLDRPGVRLLAPTPADDARLRLVHTADYLAAVRAASVDPAVTGHGLNTADDPVFPQMHEASALIVGASVAAARAVWSGATRRAVNIAGGLHHAMPDHASGFCVYNDPAIAIRTLLETGAESIAYVDVDVHHGDGVQQVFYDDPRVLTISLHETPYALFPGTGFPTETGGEHAPGSAINLALPPGTGDAGWLRAFHAVVPGAVRAFKPQLLVTQCGADAHRADPLADLRLSVDCQRTAYLALEHLADTVCGGRWLAFGGGGYALVEAVPRAWTHLLAILTGEPIEPDTPTPATWRALAEARCPQGHPPATMSDFPGAAAATVPHRPWDPGEPADAVDRAVLATRRAVFPLLGLDPYDPRD